MKDAKVNIQKEKKKRTNFKQLGKKKQKQNKQFGWKNNMKMKRKKKNINKFKIAKEEKKMTSGPCGLS